MFLQGVKNYTAIEFQSLKEKHKRIDTSESSFDYHNIQSLRLFVTKLIGKRVILS